MKLFMKFLCYFARSLFKLTSMSTMNFTTRFRLIMTIALLIPFANFAQDGLPAKKLSGSWSGNP